MSSTALRTPRQHALRAAVVVACALAVATGTVHAAPSQRTLQARAYEHGQGVERNQERAARLYCEAAREGDADSAFALGWMFAMGRGIARDDARAAALFGLAAQSGHAQAQEMLALFRSRVPELPDCLNPAADPLAWGPPEPPPAEAETPVADPVPDPFDQLPRWKQQVADLVHKHAPRFGVDPRLALSVIAVESNFDARAHSHKDARGLMQLIPETADRFDVKDAFDPLQNVRGGLAYLRFLLAYYRGDVVLAAAAYNAGEKAVDRYGGIPPYAETQAYVRKVLSLYRSERHPYDVRFAAPAGKPGLR
jgi:soluble lytic murein transglycosylase-like protein